MTAPKPPHAKSLGTPIVPGGTTGDGGGHATVSGFGWGLSPDAAKKIEIVERNIRTAVRQGKALVLR